MSKTPISPDSTVPPGMADDGGMDWGALDALTDANIAAAARSDPDTRPIDRPVSPDARRTGLAGVIRLRLRLTHVEFEARYRVPAATLEAWERGLATPDATTQAYLALIAADPDGVAATLARERQATAAE